LTVTGAFGPVTVTRGLSGLKFTVPPAMPGPVPLLPAINTSPVASPRLCVATTLPLVSVIAASILISFPAQMVILPSVAVMAPLVAVVTPSVLIAPIAKKFTLLPALKSTLPSVVVIAAATLMSRPQHTSKFPSTAVTGLLMLTSRAALRVSVVFTDAAAQLTESFTLMSPLPGVVVKRLISGGVPGAVLSVPASIVLIVTLLFTSSAASVAPVILPPVGAMVKSTGSMVQVPVLPLGAAVVTFAVFATFTVAPEVSIVPPSPPFGALASSVPPTVTVPFCMSPSSLIVPPCVSIVCASMTPVLFTAVLIS
jgi:hypothetical protein